MRRFLDTNILVYAYGRQDSAKRELARMQVHDATAEEGFVVSTQVLAEFYVTAVRLKVMGPAQAGSLVRVWSEHDTVMTTPDLILRAIALHQDHSLAFRDALIVQAALDARCDVVLTEDMQHGRRFGELEIRNPFVAPGAHEARAAYRARRTTGARGRRRP